MYPEPYQRTYEAPVIKFAFTEGARSAINHQLSEILPALLTQVGQEEGLLERVKKLKVTEAAAVLINKNFSCLNIFSLGCSSYFTSSID